MDKNKQLHSDFHVILVLQYRKTVLLHITLCCDIISYDSLMIS